MLMTRVPSPLSALIYARFGEYAAIAEATWSRLLWHQSFTIPHAPQLRPTLEAAMPLVVAPAFDLHLNRVTSYVAADGRIHWRLNARGSKPREFQHFQADLHQQLASRGVYEPCEHLAHVTLSYDAPYELPGTLWIEPILWHVDAIELVSAAVEPYRYITLRRWQLPPVPQGTLF